MLVGQCTDGLDSQAFNVFILRPCS